MSNEVKAFDELKVGDNLYTWRERIEENGILREIDMVKFTIKSIKDEMTVGINQRFFYLEENAMMAPWIAVGFEQLDWCVAVCKEGDFIVMTSEDEVREEVERRYANSIRRFENAIAESQKALETLKENSKKEVWL